MATNNLFLFVFFFSAILANKFPPAFPLKYQQKDMRLALALADQVEQPLPVSAAVNEVFYVMVYFFEGIMRGGINFMALLKAEFCANDHHSPLTEQAPNFCASCGIEECLVM